MVCALESVCHLQGKCAQPSCYVTSWNQILSRKPILLYIEPPEINDVLEHKRRSVALFCFEAAQYQLRQNRHVALVHPVASTFWTILQASAFANNPLISWGRIAQCPTMSITSSFAKGQLDPLLCRPRAVKKKTCAKPSI